MSDSPADVLVIGYGNTLRGDDGLGPAVARAVEALARPGVRTLAVHQLTPELAELLAGVRRAVFVDARLTGGAVVDVQPLEAAAAGDLRTHTADPRQLLALAASLYGRAPEAWAVTVRGERFGLGENLSPVARERLRDAVEQIAGLLCLAPARDGATIVVVRRS